MIFYSKVQTFFYLKCIYQLRSYGTNYQLRVWVVKKQGLVKDSTAMSSKLSHSNHLTNNLYILNPLNQYILILMHFRAKALKQYLFHIGKKQTQSKLVHTYVSKSIRLPLTKTLHQIPQCPASYALCPYTLLYISCLQGNKNCLLVCLTNDSLAMTR